MSQVSRAGKPIVVRSIAEAVTPKPTRGDLIVYRFATIPMGIEMIHERVVRGDADGYFGTILRVVHVIPTDDDRARWPSLLKDAKKLHLVYNKRGRA